MTNLATRFGLNPRVSVMLNEVKHLAREEEDAGDERRSQQSFALPAQVPSEDSGPGPSLRSGRREERPA